MSFYSRVRRQFKIVYEHIKVPSRLIRTTLHILGLYRFGLRNAADIQLRHHKLDCAGLPAAFDGYRLLIFSDFHIDGPLPLVERLGRLLPGIEADMALFLGDYRYRITGPIENAINRLQKIIMLLNMPDGILAIRGNHDSRQLMNRLAGFGLTILDNRAVKIERDHECLYFIGVDDPHYDQTDDLPGAMKDVPAAGFKILLAHTAEIYRQARRLGISLYLCGHTHGGQICSKKSKPLITNVRAPRSWAFGFWKFGSMTGYTTSGVGASAVPVRFNCPPEIVLLTLHKKEKYERD